MMRRIGEKEKIALIKGFLKECDWVIDSSKNSIGYTIGYDKFVKFEYETGFDFSRLWDELTDQQQLQIMHECSGLHTQFCSN